MLIQLYNNLPLEYEFESVKEFEQMVKKNGKIAGVVYRKKFNVKNNQYYMYCVHEGIYKSQAKTERTKRITSTVRSGCKASLYARIEKNTQGEEKCILKMVKGVHNHLPLSENEFKTAPQSTDLSDLAKAEALKHFKEGRKDNLCC